MNDDALLFVAIAGGLLIFGGGLFAFIYGAVASGVKPVRAAGNRVLESLRAEAYETVYDTMLTPRFRDSTGPRMLAEQIEAMGGPIQAWRWGRIESSQETAFLRARLSLAGAQSGRMNLSLVKAGDDEPWLVDGIEFRQGT